VTEVAEAWKIIEHVNTPRDDQYFDGRGLVHACCVEAAKFYNLTDVDVVGRQSVVSPGKQGNGMMNFFNVLPDDFVRAVDQCLPDQPWEKRIHIRVAHQLNCHPKAVHRAIQRLITDGRRNLQRDGVMYGLDGSVLSVASSDNAQQVGGP